MKKLLVIPIFIPHLGCPHKCVFCNQRKITGKTTQVTTSYIKETIDFFLTFKEGKDKVEVAFFGGTFTGLPISLQRDFLSTVAPYIQKGYVDYIRLSTRPDYINEDILIFLRDHNVRIIELGIQSLVDEILEKAERGHTKEDSEKASILIKEKGFILGHQIMPGLPGDTKDTILQTVRESIRLRPEIVRIYPTLVLENTELFNMYKKGDYTPLSLENTIKIIAISYLYYMANNINVIRIGLQTTDEINKEHIIAGPYHPSLGEIIRTRIFLWMILYLVKSKNNMNDNDGNVIIYTNKKDLPYVVGYKKENIKRLKNFYPKLSIKTDSFIKIGTVFFERNKKVDKISLVDFSKKVYKNIINIESLLR